jgi:hypothetical protein
VTALEPGSAPAPDDEKNSWSRKHPQRKNDVPQRLLEIVLVMDGLLWHKSFAE